jgi:hypothetical protein
MLNTEYPTPNIQVGNSFGIGHSIFAILPKAPKECLRRTPLAIIGY